MDIHVQVKDDEYQEFKDKHLRELWSATGAFVTSLIVTRHSSSETSIYIRNTLVLYIKYS